jgi:hypothetical protein
MDLTEIEWGGVDWNGLNLVRDKWRALVNEPSGSIKCWETIQRLYNLWPLKKRSGPHS